VKSPRWHSDYFAAQELARKQNRPLAVFVGAGDLGFHQVSSDSLLSGEAMHTLAEHFVCVFLDRQDKAQHDLITQLAFKTGPGLVLSDRAGARQAVWHAGTLSHAALLQALKKAVNE